LNLNLFAYLSFRYLDLLQLLWSDWVKRQAHNLAILCKTTCLLSASYLRHFSLTVAGLRALLSRFLEGALYKYPE